MAARQPPLAVVLSEAASTDLFSIWRWNCNHWGLAQADAYDAFLRQGIASLGVRHQLGRAVPGHARFQWVVLQRRRRGHGHLLVYRVEETTVYVLRIFHTAQDWNALM